MATTHPLQARPADQLLGPEAAEAAAIVSDESLVPSPGSLTLSPPLARLSIELDVAVPVRDFRVRNLLVLESGQVIESQWPQGEDMPLAAGKVQLAWSEFEVVDDQLAVRVTRLV